MRRERGSVITMQGKGSLHTQYIVPQSTVQWRLYRSTIGTVQHAAQQSLRTGTVAGHHQAQPRGWVGYAPGRLGVERPADLDPTRSALVPRPGAATQRQQT